MNLFRKKKDSRPSMRLKLFFSLGSVAAILILSGAISIIEYRRMSAYVSDLIASNIKSINLSVPVVDENEKTPKISWDKLTPVESIVCLIRSADTPPASEIAP